MNDYPDEQPIQHDDPTAGSALNVDDEPLQARVHHDAEAPRKPRQHTDLSAYSEGICAWIRDDDNGTLTDNPYREGTMAFRSWYEGYNDAGRE